MSPTDAYLDMCDFAWWQVEGLGDVIGNLQRLQHNSNLNSSSDCGIGYKKWLYMSDERSLTNARHPDSSSYGDHNVPDTQVISVGRWWVPWIFCCEDHA